MSESRQRFTGKVWKEVGFWAGWGLFIWLILITLPLFTKELQIYRVEPWMLSPEDLTWKRLAYNILSKPGIKMMIFGGLMAVVAMTRFRGEKVEQSKDEVKIKLNKLSYSLEWVIDGWKTNNLIEYGSFVEAV